MRRAAARAASRRGSSITMRCDASQVSSSRASGTRVVLPAPGGACSTTLVRSASAARSAGQHLVDRKSGQGRTRARHPCNLAPGGVRPSNLGTRSGMMPATTGWTGAALQAPAAETALTAPWENSDSFATRSSLPTAISAADASIYSRAAPVCVAAASSASRISTARSSDDSRPTSARRWCAFGAAQALATCPRRSRSPDRRPVAVLLSSPVITTGALAPSLPLPIADMIRRLLLVAVPLLASFLAPALRAQGADAVRPIRAVSTDATNERVTISGRATASAGQMQSNAFEVALQDSSGGIRIFSRVLEVACTRGRQSRSRRARSSAIEAISSSSPRR